MSGACSPGAAGGAVIEMLIVVCACALPQSARALAMAVAVAKVQISEAFRETAVFMSPDIAAQLDVRGSEKVGDEQALSICVGLATSGVRG